jgi:hypothetical protein
MGSMVDSFAIDVKRGRRYLKFSINAKGGVVGKCLTSSVCLSLMASTTVKMAGSKYALMEKQEQRMLKRNSVEENACSKAQDTGVPRGEGRQRSRPLRTCNSSKVGRKVCKAREGAQPLLDRLKKKSESRWISLRNPISHQIGQELHEVYHQEKPR